MKIRWCFYRIIIYYLKQEIKPDFAEQRWCAFLSHSFLLIYIYIYIWICNKFHAMPWACFTYSAHTCVIFRYFLFDAFIIYLTKSWMCRWILHERLNILHQRSCEMNFVFTWIQGYIKEYNLSLKVFAFPWCELYHLKIVFYSK